MSVLDAVLRWHDAGFCVVPPLQDGTKAPMGLWLDYQRQRPSRRQVELWYQDGRRTGVGLIMGAVSGGAVMFELEGRAMAEGLNAALVELVAAAGLHDLWQRIAMNGYRERTPTGGVHLIYRVRTAEGERFHRNTKLAARPGTADELAAEIIKAVEAGKAPPERLALCLAETRGEGGYVVVAPSHGTVHELGTAWEARGGSTPETVPWISAEEHEAFLSVVRALDQMPRKDPVQRSAPVPRHDSQGISPGDDFEDRVDWADALLLGGAGWAAVFQRGGTTYWRRPGKDGGVSATTGHEPDRDRLYVFSSSTLFDIETPYNKFGAFALLHHGGDYAAAAGDLRRLGYGAVVEAGGGSLIEEILGPKPSEVSSFVGVWDSGRTDSSVRVRDRDSWDAPTPPPAQGVAPTDPLEEALIVEAVRRLRISREARRRVDIEEQLASWSEPVSHGPASEELLIEDGEEGWLVDNLIPEGGNVLLAAGYKSGKTTLMGNLIKSFCDGRQFLHRFRVEPHEGRIALWNYELTPRMQRAWLRDVGIENLGMLSMLHLRGRRMPLMVPQVEDWAVEWLSSRGVATWIVDPFARAFSGSGDGSNNEEVGEFLETLDVIKSRAGVQCLILPTHTGKGLAEPGEPKEARGAVRLHDWADVTWSLVVDDQRRRFFSARGRDVEIEEGMLEFNAETRGLSMGGWTQAAVRWRDFTDQIIDYVRQHPGSQGSDIALGVDAAGVKVKKALARLEEQGKVAVSGDGSRSGKAYWPEGSAGMAEVVE